MPAEVRLPGHGVAASWPNLDQPQLTVGGGETDWSEDAGRTVGDGPDACAEDAQSALRGVDERPGPRHECAYFALQDVGTFPGIHPTVLAGERGRHGAAGVRLRRWRQVAADPGSQALLEQVAGDGRQRLLEPRRRLGSVEGGASLGDDRARVETFVHPHERE